MTPTPKTPRDAKATLTPKAPAKAKVAAKSQQQAKAAAQVGRHPHLVLTLRRTGGTSMMSFLARISPFPTVQHEPFNKQRVWGHLTEAFDGKFDSAAFAEALDTTLVRQPNIKHCIDVVPLGLTRALIAACHARGYQIFVQTRRNEVGRLRSLFISQVTGVWGQEQAAEVYPAVLAGTAKLRAVAPASITAQAKRDAMLLAKTRAELVDRDIPFDEWVFEDIYSSDASLRAHASAIAAKLGVTVAPDDPRLDILNEGKGLSAKEILPLIPGLAQVEEILAGMAAKTVDQD
jgi:hypothetical protein